MTLTGKSDTAAETLASSDYVLLPIFCFEYLCSYLLKEKHILIPEKFLSIPELSAPIFVTWSKRDNFPPSLPESSLPHPSTSATSLSHVFSYSLRGCIGTFHPAPLSSLLLKYSLSSALEDSRFSPIAASELHLLKCSVSILLDFETITKWDDWDIGVHGIEIRFNHPKARSMYSATYLPEVAGSQGWSKLQTLESLVRKSGYDGPYSNDLLKNMSVRRYKSKKFCCTYDEYMSYKLPLVDKNLAE